VAIVLYDLAGKDGVRFSPNCWRTRMALAHKGLDTETRATRFTEIPGILDGTQKTLPIIDDCGKIISDSWVIANYLEKAYPDRPSLFGGAGGRALTEFMLTWCNSVVQSAIISFIILDIHDALTAEDRAYFRTSREARFGKTLEAMQGGREARLESFRAALQPLRLHLKTQAFLGGATPLYADYLVFGALQWARTVSRFALLDDTDPVSAWFDRCLDLHGGLGRRAASICQ
jgi:glutathione S-transferase